MTTRKIALCVSILLLTALVFSGCTKQETKPAPTEAPTSAPSASAPTDPSTPSNPAPTEPAPTEPIPNDPFKPETPKVTPSGNTSSDDELRQIGDAILKEQYGITDLDNFKINISRNGNGGASIRYELFIHGYDTNRSVFISFKADGTVNSISGDVSKYSKYLPHVTAEAVQAAAQKLDAMVGSHPHPEYYYSIDQEGYLCLGTEVIVYYETPKTDSQGNTIAGCGFDHDHRFYSIQVCRCT